MFVLHNFCKLNGESIAESSVRMAISYDAEFQPETSSSRYSTATGSNERRGKAVRRILTEFFDP